MTGQPGGRGAAGRAIAILGGSFDPVHFGHLRSAFEVMQACRFTEVRFIPSRLPPHRAAPVAAPDLRMAMLRAAIAGQDGFVVDDRELRRPGPSYTWDTLASLRGEVGAVPLAFIIGGDALLGLPDWHRWTELTDLAHLVVVHRPGFELPIEGPVAALLAQRRAAGSGELLALPAGRIWVQPVSQLEISSSAIRSLVSDGGDPRFLVPDPVRGIILEKNCFRSVPGPGNTTEVQARA